MKNFETVCRTILFCITVLAAVYFGSYLVDLEERVTTLEERVEHGLVIPLPLDLNRFRFRLIEGDETQ